MSSVPPVVLVLAGHDPSGGAGIQADIETLCALGCQATSALTCLTVQDPDRVHAVHPVAPALLARQVRTLAAALPPVALKIGLVPTPELARTLAELLPALPAAHRVLDPVLQSGGGRALATADALRPLLPLATLITPNRREARLLSGADTPEACAGRLLDLGAPAVLITGADEAGADEVVNTLFLPGRTLHWRWPRLPGVYHGSGCTLASAITAHLARGLDLERAVAEGQAFTHQALARSRATGQTQRLPWRCRLEE